MKNGVPSVVLSIDNEPVYSHHLEKFAFANTRYVNSLLDYPLLISWLPQDPENPSYIALNNKNDIYGKVKNRGIISFTDNRPIRWPIPLPIFMEMPQSWFSG